jgi:hypothetical protein
MVAENRQLVDGAPLPRPDYPFVVLQILLRRWLLHQGPMTTKELTETAGCSYPTAARALAGLRNSIHRHASRQIGLERFPDQEWGRMVALADRARSTRRFVDSSGQPQAPARLVEQFRELRIEGVAVSGVAGARHLYPDIDIVGEPRLDLTVHCPGRHFDDSFLQGLDPALIRSEDPRKPAAVVLHALRRTTPFFERGRRGESWADPVECLLDLHDLRLDAQARALVAHLQSAVA